MARTFKVTDQYGDKSFNELNKELTPGGGSYFGRTDVLGNLLGIDPNAKLKAGQTLTFNDESQLGGQEYKALEGVFGPGMTAADAQAAEEKGFMDALNAKIGGQEKLGDAASRIGGELGLPDLRQSAFNLTSTLKNIPKVQETISKQVGMSAPRLQSRIATEQGRIAPLAQDATSQTQFAEGELGKRLGYTVAEQEKELRPFFEAGLPLLQDKLAREHSNYQMDKQAELDQILAKQTQGFTLTRDEQTRAHDLAMDERNYVNQVNLTKLGTDENIRQAKALKAAEGGSGKSSLSYLQPNGSSPIKKSGGSSSIGTLWNE